MSMTDDELGREIADLMHEQVWQEKLDRLQSLADELAAALRWALPLLEKFCDDPDVRRSMNKLNMMKGI